MLISDLKTCDGNCRKFSKRRITGKVSNKEVKGELGGKVHNKVVVRYNRVNVRLV